VWHLLQFLLIVCRQDSRSLELHTRNAQAIGSNPIAGAPVLPYPSLGGSETTDLKQFRLRIGDDPVFYDVVNTEVHILAVVSKGTSRGLVPKGGEVK
jgi:hypothetical protein